MPSTNKTKLANRYGLNLYFYKYGAAENDYTDPSKALAVIDFANEISFELSGDLVWATGGRGHKRLIGFRDPYEGTMTISTQITNDVLLDILTGGDGSEAGRSHVFKNTDDTNNYFEIRGYTVYKGEGGEVVYEKLIAHKAMVSPSYSMSYTGEGDPQSIDIEFQLAADDKEQVLTLERADETEEPTAE